MKPATQFLELIVDNPEKIFNEYIIKEENHKNGKLPINYYFQGSNNISFDEFSNILDKQIKVDKVKNDSNKVKKKINRIINLPTNKKKSEFDFIDFTKF